MSQLIFYIYLFTFVNFIGCTTEVNAPSGVIESRGYPTPVPRRSYSFCSWMITVPEGRRVSLNIVDFDPEPVHSTLENKLMVRNYNLHLNALKHYLNYKSQRNLSE